MASARISDKDRDYLFSLKESDVTKKLLINLFAYGTQKKPRFNPNDKVKLPKGKLGNKEDIDTTVGRYIFNLFIISPHFSDYLGYINKAVDGGVLDDIENQLSEYLLDKSLNPEFFIDYLNRIQWLGYIMTDFIVPSMSLNVIMPNRKVEARKKELMRQHKEALSKGDPIIATQIEEELIKLAKGELNGDPAMDLYVSGISKFGNHYKSFNIMKGAIRDNSTGNYNVSMTNYMDGIQKDEYHYYGDTIVYAAHSRAIGTQKGGYETKKMFAAFQTVSLDKEGTDCRTTKTLKFVMSKKNYRLFLFRYIIEGSKLVQLTNSNIESYIGKVIHLRSPMFCQSEKLCNKCSGDLYYKLGIENIGLTATKVSSTLLNLSLKNFHDTSIHLQRIDFRNYID
jgi:hypothetical protein